VAACQGGRLVVHFTNRKNAPFSFFHMNGDATSAGLLLVYPIFAAIHSILTDGARSFSEVAGTVLIVPVFALFSAPIAWPVTLVFAWTWHRRLQFRGTGIGP